MTVKAMMSVLLAIVIIAIPAVPSIAQGTPIVAEPDAAWMLEPSGISIPVELAGLARAEMQDLSTNQHDILTQFRSSDGDTLATLYIYRTGYRDLALWFDQSYSAFSTNPGLGDQMGGTRTPDLVTLYGEGPPDTGIVAFPIEGNYRSTGLGLTERNGWLVKVRVSSRRLDRDGNELVIRSILNRLPLPERTSEAIAYAAARACEAPLPQSACRL